MRGFVIAVLCLLAACGRPLTEGERRFLGDLHGPGLNPAPVRLVETGFVGLTSRRVPARPRVTCRERIAPPVKGDTHRIRAAGMVGFNTIFLRPDWYLADYLAGYPEELNLLQAMFLAHEMTHVWQWQNRHVTGYHPLRGAAEHAPDVDPYLFDINENTRFLDFAYEQQASLVEEYVCCRALAPDAPRTRKLAALLGQVMDLPPARPQSRVDIGIEGWELELGGICD